MARMYRRRAIHLDAMRFAKSTQVKLDEIYYRIEQDKKRILMLNRFEKIKVWNELREIRRVFVPRYIPGETNTPDEEQSDDSSKKESFKTPGSTQTDLTSLPSNNNVPKLYSNENVRCDLSSNVRVRKHRNSSRERKISPASTRLKTHEPVSKTTSSGTSEKDFVFNQNERAQNSVGLRQSWCVSNLRKNSQDDNYSRNLPESSLPATVNEDVYPTNLVVPEVHSPMSSSTSESVTPRSHSSLSQYGVKSPSNSMLSVACGYMSFKKLLRNKRQNDSFVSPRFRTQSESDETIASNSAFLRSTSAVTKTKTANVTKQRTTRTHEVENTTEKETVSSDNNESRKPSRRRLSAENSLSNGQTKGKPRARKLSADWIQSDDRNPVGSSKRCGESKARIDDRKLIASTAKLQVHEEEEWREEWKSIKKIVAWTANDAHTMKSLTA